MRTLRPKCVECNKACRKNQRQFQCTICKKSVHRKCSNLSITDIYKHEEDNIPFYCRSCNDAIYPLSSEDELNPLLNISNSGVEFQCGSSLDSDHLNLLFSAVNNDDDPEKTLPTISNEFKPIPDKYFNKDNIPFDEFEITFQNQISDQFSSIGINIRSLVNTKNFAKLQAFLDSLFFS